jgi:hypothetical protein
MKNVAVSMTTIITRAPDIIWQEFSALAIHGILFILNEGPSAGLYE